LSKIFLDVDKITKSRALGLSFHLTKVAEINPKDFGFTEIRNITFLGVDTCESPYQDKDGNYYILAACTTEPHPSTAHLGVFRTKDLTHLKYLGYFRFADYAPAVGLVVGNIVYIYYADWTTTPPKNVGLMTISLSDLLAGRFDVATDMGHLTGIYDIGIDPWIIKVGTRYYLYLCELMAKYPVFRIYQASSHGLGWTHICDVYDFAKAESHSVWYIDGLYYVPAFTFVNSYDAGLGRNSGVMVAVYRDSLLTEPVTKIPVIPWSGQESDSIGTIVVGDTMHLYFAPYWGKSIHIYKTRITDKTLLAPPSIRHFFYLPNTTYITHNLEVDVGTYCWCPWSLFPYRNKTLEFHADAPVEISIEIDAMGFGEFRFFDAICGIKDVHFPLPEKPFNMVRIRFWRVDGGAKVTVTASLNAQE